MNVNFYNISGTELPLAHVDKIVIYGNGKKLFERESTFPRYEFHTNNGEQIITETLYNEQLTAITLKKDVKRALKENLNRSDNYTLTYTPDYMKWEKRTALYIHVDEINVTDLGNCLAHVTDEEKCYLHTVQLHFKNNVRILRYHFERIELTDDECKTWKLPANGKWSTCYGTIENPCYDTYDYTNTETRFPNKLKPKYRKGVIKRWVTVETMENYEMLSTERYYTKYEYSEERKRKDAIAKRINESKQFSEQWSNYTITKLENALGYKLH